MQRKSIRPFAVAITVLSLVVMLGAQTAFASDHGPNTPARQLATQASIAGRGPLSSVGNSNCQYTPSDAHCDGYDVGLSNCGPNNGAYWVGAYSGEITFVEVWWSPKCKSNYVYSYVPSGLNTCYGGPCNAVVEAWMNRAPYSASYCNTGYPNGNNITCENAAIECHSPGNCGTGGAMLYFCDQKVNGDPDVICNSSTTFHGEFIGTSTQWWSSFETDMLYSPTYAVQGCVYFVNSSYPGFESPAYCTKWH
ncbi:MAG TPA: hypothetical protein VFU88_13775 [Ktedonobacterales bacterium]|nr:hypothetical protein [Ktedonobacterales bacterium]